MSAEYKSLDNVNPNSYEHKSTYRKLGEAGFECLATFLFMFIIFFSKGNVQVFGFGFWVLLSIFGGITGAHVNPAITLGFYVTDKDYSYGLMKMGLYFLSQFTGCILAVLLGYAMRLKSETSLFFIAPSLIDATQMRSFFGEFFATGTFFFVIAVVCHPKYPICNSAPLNTAMIVGWFYCVAMIMGSFSGSALNPAVLLVVNIAASVYGKTSVPYKFLGVDILGQLTGVVAFGLIYTFIYCPFLDMMHEENNAKAAEFKKAEIKASEQV